MRLLAEQSSTAQPQSLHQSYAPSTGMQISVLAVIQSITHTDEMLSKQLALKCHHPQHPNQHLTQVVEPLHFTTPYLKTGINEINTQTVNETIRRCNNNNNRVLGVLPPAIDISKASKVNTTNHTIPGLFWRVQDS